jgi:hypothetical protein
MALSDTSKILIAIKKLVGKAHTSNDKDVANEALPTGLTVSSNTVFGEKIPTTINQTNNALYVILTGSGITGNGQVEYLRLPSSFIAGSDTSSGRHGFELKLPSDYESNSKNPLAGTYPYKNNQIINITSGALQLVSPSYATEYEAKPFSGGNTTKDNGTQIPVLDARDWSLDYFNGVFFQQDPPGTGDHSDNPDHIQAYLYIGKYLDERIVSASSDTVGNNNSQANYKFNDYLGQGNGTNTVFTLNKSPTNSAHISVYINGLLQMPATSITSAPFQDYSVTGSNVYFTTSSLPAAESIVMANYTTIDDI